MPSKNPLYENEICKSVGIMATCNSCDRVIWEGETFYHGGYCRECFEETNEITQVVFYKEKNNTILAVFPKLKYSNTYNDKLATCYTHIGQHSCAHPGYYKKRPKASETEYQDLKTELESIGYRLEVLD